VDSLSSEFGDGGGSGAVEFVVLDQFGGSGFGSVVSGDDLIRSRDGFVVPKVDGRFVSGAGGGLAEDEVGRLGIVEAGEVGGEGFRDHSSGVSGQGDHSLAMFLAGIEFEASLVPSDGSFDSEGLAVGVEVLDLES